MTTPDPAIFTYPFRDWTPSPKSEKRIPAIAGSTDSRILRSRSGMFLRAGSTDSRIRRQAVDKQLAELFYWGLVDRSAVFAATGRPRIVYRVTKRGADLVALLERAAQDFRAALREDLDRELESLESKLAAGEIAEEMYFKKRKEIEARYAWVVGP
ncbi:MAG: hypothetical protein A3K65_09125 [Euryarchaeota archaeon RBG_16_68_12]|nr:MAG: hypothetical protein A3K65_09125 [Euryarchaeota archaeon RBG_16_68_12]